MVLKTEYTVAGIIIALLIGSGAGYIYGQSPIAGYQENIDRLKTENLELQILQAQIEERDERINDLKLLNEEKDLQISSLLSQIEGLELRLECIFSG
jgi:hypothetical protein